MTTECPLQLLLLLLLVVVLCNVKIIRVETGELSRERAVKQERKENKPAAVSRPSRFTQTFDNGGKYLVTLTLNSRCPIILLGYLQDILLVPVLPLLVSCGERDSRPLISAHLHITGQE